MIENKWKKGILFDYQQEEQKIWVGVKSNGKTQRCYITNHTDIETGEWTPYEILNHIIELARKQKAPNIWNACRRNVAISSKQQFNMMYDEFNNSNLKYKELLEEIPVLIEEATKLNKTFVAKNLINLSDKLRKEYKAQDITRWQLESYICRGCVKKTKSADETAELKRSNNQYQSGSFGECPMWKKNEENCWNCTANSKEFIIKKKGELRE